MRFFKSFSLLHRRSRSDSALASPAQATGSAVLIIGPSSHDFPSSPTDVIEPKTVSFNQRVFEAELENQHLTRVNSSLVLRLTLAETQLQLTMSELYAEMHKSVQLHRQVQRDKNTISELQTTCQQYRHSLNSEVTSTLAGLLSSRVSSPRQSSSGDEQHYPTALKLVLKTRQELRNTKKIAMFWKRKAKTVPAHADLITPSPSDISEVENVLSRERMEAVNALQRRRQMRSPSGTQINLPPTKSAPGLVPPVPNTSVDGFEYSQSFSETCSPGEQAVSAYQNRLRRRAGSVDLRQSASIASV